MAGNEARRNESSILGDCVVALSEIGCVPIRINCGLLLGNGGHMVRAAPSGFSDILVLAPNGVAVFIEVKSETGRLRPQQKAFAEMVRSLGFVHAVARSADEAVNSVKRAACRSATEP